MRAGSHKARRHRCDLNIVARQLSPNRVRETGQCKLAGAVRRKMRHGNFATDGGDVHDTSATPKAHLWHNLRNQFVWRPKMHSHGAIVIFAGHVIERTDFDDTGVIDQDIDPVEMIDDFLDSALNLIPLEQIAFDSEDFSAARSEIGLGTREFFWITCEESNLSALAANVSR